MEHGDEIDNKRDAVPFTARLIAHYRAEETKRKDPLIHDPFAEQLAGDLSSYFDEHKRTRGTGDYAIVRTHYIDEKILTPWCNAQKESQIVILGAGLDARAYRILSLKKNKHTVFEIDFEVVNRYKEEVLQDDAPLCKLIRISLDLTKPEWISALLEGGFSRTTPTLWILEGLVYYIHQDQVLSILQLAAKNTVLESQIFVDICVPGLSLAKFGPFMMHFQWGLNEEEVSAFFEKAGWDITYSFADDHDHGRDVGQRGLIFIQGTADPSRIGVYLQLEDQIKESLLKISDPELQEFASTFLGNIIPSIHTIVDLYQKNREDGLDAYRKFIGEVTPSILKIMSSFSNFLSIGHISPRLLKDPLKAEISTPEEEEAHIVGYLKAILYLAYCGIKGLEGEKVSNTNLKRESRKIQKLTDIPSLIELIHEEIG
jgi:methyltransferase (TIGR00027 family)